MKVDNVPLVSICCVTYNHEGYIQNCLDGFISQKTTFPFEVLIHDDASTDNTAKIIRENELKYPNIFRCYYQSENQFLIQNTLLTTLFPQSKGKYIALCEGDDYWIDPFKLQKQVDFLEENENAFFCCTNFIIYDQEENNYKENRAIKVLKKDQILYRVNLKNFLNPFLLKTNTIIFRNTKDFEYLNKYHLTFSDIFLFAFILEKGDGYFLNDVTTVYRESNSGIWSKKSHLEKSIQNYKTFKSMNKYFAYRYFSIYEAYLFAYKDIVSSEDFSFFNKMNYRIKHLIVRIHRQIILKTKKNNC